ncbi:Transglycosylase domain protein [Xylanimonas cellulosilytica DSM 15894]|uniref:Transglycosylase domain protein n=1 Tax=Xylanimonas cellulosilytica (strain DSM 15894 / JCM 12276 / CECT 5975 / KCTC 9989 / LMG 20990 / NBRC 107835 / XIL07) TaxID=446471 RepID=D1BXV1_XYLCX|nr:resuscitation-promoting factor [Xylanimonas cellulosilytica]ACZ31742.1 Transglycosylase domain protein [Xylanimonas cellulosilytica DSM 15894]
MPHADDATSALPVIPNPAISASDDETHPATMQIPAVRSRRPRRRRFVPVVTVLALVGVAAGAGVGALVDARKTVLLDVDGEVTQVTTFAGSVENLLRSHDVMPGEHDAVTPALDGPLRDGADVVVRFGREVTFEADGTQSTDWIAALDADDALRLLATRGSDVRLVASRSGDRVELPLRLSADGGQVDVVADGETQTLDYDGGGVEALLERAGVEVAAEDLVSIAPAGSRAAGRGTVTVVVERVVVEDVTTTTPLPYTRTERRDPQRFSDLSPRVEQAGVEGVRTVVERVTTIDGVETERVLVSDDEVAPVNEVVAVGTRQRPAPQPAPAPGGGSVSDDVWVRLAQCESGGRPDIVSASGRFHGLYQFSVATWRSVGGQGLPSQASPAEQRMRAEMLQARSGWGQWPACSRRLGLR